MDELIKRLRNRRICIQQSGGLDDFPLLREAADAIEELQKELREEKVDNVNLTGWLAEEHAKHLWIPVTERLPEKWTWVLVESNGDMWVAFLDKCGIWCDEHGEVNFITHWMPLPEPPKEDGEA